MPTITRDWATVDYYAALGVAPTASDEEIARAFRALAKQLHPDRADTIDLDDVRRFKEVTAAYEVLSNPGLRRDYDSVQQLEGRELRVRVEPMGRTPRPPATPLIRWTPFKARAAMVLGVLCLLGGVAMSVFMIGVHEHEASANNGRVKVSAIATTDDQGRTIVEFDTTNGKTVTIPPPTRSNPGVLNPGDTITLRYLKTNPSNVIVDESHFARDFTLWFVAVKLLFGSPLIFGLGLRRSRKLRRARQARA